jgi:hypothetical protein
MQAGARQYGHCVRRIMSGSEFSYSSSVSSGANKLSDSRDARLG